MNIYKTNLETGKLISFKFKGSVFYQIHDEFYRIRIFDPDTEECLLKEFGKKLIKET